jgi:omega-6 fatty acid desaturase (delta-12 desaturase)
MQSIETSPQSTPATPSAPRSGKELIDATRPYAEEDRTRSWLHVAETFGALALFLTMAVAPPATAAMLPLKLLGALLAGLTWCAASSSFTTTSTARSSSNSKAAKWLFELYGCYVLTPASVWKQTHNYHHAHTAKIVGSHIGSYMMLTTDMYAKATPGQRRMYRALRTRSTCSSATSRSSCGACACRPSCATAEEELGRLTSLLALHVASSRRCRISRARRRAVFVHVLPLFVAVAAGSYLFYAQHNFPGMHVPRARVEYTRAALESSSYMECGPVMRWFTATSATTTCTTSTRRSRSTGSRGDGGDPRAAAPGEDHLARPRDVLACLRLKLWDPAAAHGPASPADTPPPARGSTPSETTPRGA